MKRILLASVVLIGFTAALVLSNGERLGIFQFAKEERNPVTHFRFADDPDEFQFAIVSDRTGGHRAGVFSQAVQKIELMQPTFVVSVGDLIEGGKSANFKGQWEEFDGYLNKFSMPFFYVGGNHDIGTVEGEKYWLNKLGKRYYHFVYRNILFLVLNTEDPPGVNGAIGEEQVEWARKTLAANDKVRWTMVFMHRPIWNNSKDRGWAGIEKALAGREFTAFCGHVHRYQKFVRQGKNFYQLATTGGGSALRGVEYGEFDHFVWVTMKKDGPVFANIMLDGVHNESLKPITSDEKGKIVVRKPTHPASGKVFLDGTPTPGAQILFTPIGKDTGVKANAVVEADGSFTLTSYKKNDGAVVGDYTVTIVWKEKLPNGKAGPSLLPAKYGLDAESGLKRTIRPGENRIEEFNLKK